MLPIIVLVLGWPFVGWGVFQFWCKRAEMRYFESTYQCPYGLNHRGWCVSGWHNECKWYLLWQVQLTCLFLWPTLVAIYTIRLTFFGMRWLIGNAFVPLLNTTFNPLKVKKQLQETPLDPYLEVANHEVNAITSSLDD